MTGSCFIFALITSVVWGWETEFISSQFYAAEMLCHIDERLMMGCSRQVLFTRNPMECAVQCNMEFGCVGVSLNAYGDCFNHFHCSLLNNTCSTRSQHHSYISKNCANGGTLNPMTQYCECANGWIGSTCQERPTDCYDLIMHGYPKGTHRTSLDPDKDGQDLMDVYCSINPASDYTGVVIAIHEGNIDFNLTMEVYKDGFYVDNRNLFIGLKNWHALSNMGYTKVFISVDFGETGRLYRYYRDFYLRDDYKIYSFFHGETDENGSGPILSTENRLGDCFGPLQFAPFLTRDEDNSYSCASQAGSGWWYTTCESECNLFNWGRGHQASRPEHQRIVIPGVDPDLVSSKLQNVAIFAERG